MVNLLKLFPTLPQRMMRTVPIGWGDDGATLTPGLLKVSANVPAGCLLSTRHLPPQIRGRSSSLDLVLIVPQTLERVARLRGPAYGQLALTASMLMDEARKGSMEQRVSELKNILLGKVGFRLWGSGGDVNNLDTLAMSSTLAVDLLPSIFADSDERARSNAMEVGPMLLPPGLDDSGI